MDNAKIARVEWARLVGKRPRHAGCNARLGAHGIEVRPAVARITTDDGAFGFGPASLGREGAETILGLPLSTAFTLERGVDPLFLPRAGNDGQTAEYPLWDLAAKRAGRPVYALAATVVGGPAPTEPLQVRCYDTSLYIDDLGLTSEDEAARLIASE